jgi:hypothetical protein
MLSLHSLFKVSIVCSPSFSLSGPSTHCFIPIISPLEDLTNDTYTHNTSPTGLLQLSPNLLSRYAMQSVQWNLDLSFFKGVEKNDEYGETINPENHFFLTKKKSYIVFFFLVEFCLN